MLKNNNLMVFNFLSIKKQILVKIASLKCANKPSRFMNASFSENG